MVLFIPTQSAEMVTFLLSSLFPVSPEGIQACSWAENFITRMNAFSECNADALQLSSQSCCVFQVTPHFAGLCFQSSVLGVFTRDDHPFQPAPALS